MSSPKRRQPAHDWLVTVDIRRGRVAARPDVEPDNMIDELVGLDVPVAVIDLDRSIDGALSTDLMERLVRRHPGQLWLGGRVDPREGLHRQLIAAGAAGVILGCSSLIRDGAADVDALHAATQGLLPRQLKFAVDVADGYVVTHGFTMRTRLPAFAIVETLIFATAGRIDIVYTDVKAATRQSAPAPNRALDIAEAYPGTTFWYAGGLADWHAVDSTWSSGLGAIIGRAFLEQPLGLSMHGSFPTCQLPQEMVK